MSTNSFVWNQRNNKAPAPVIKTGTRAKLLWYHPDWQNCPLIPYSIKICSLGNGWRSRQVLLAQYAFVLPSKVHSARFLLPQSHRLRLSEKRKFELTILYQRFFRYCHYYIHPNYFCQHILRGHNILVGHIFWTNFLHFCCFYFFYFLYRKIIVSSIISHKKYYKIVSFTPQLKIRILKPLWQNASRAYFFLFFIIIMYRKV